MPGPEVLGTLPTERATATTAPHVIGEPVVEVQGLRKVAPPGSPAQAKAAQVFAKATVSVAKLYKKSLGNKTFVRVPAC